MTTRGSLPARGVLPRFPFRNSTISRSEGRSVGGEGLLLLPQFSGGSNRNGQPGNKEFANSRLRLWHPSAAVWALERRPSSTGGWRGGGRGRRRTTLLALFTTAAGRPAKGHNSGRRPCPYPSDSPDSGTCGNDWAEDTFNREFTV